MISRVTLLSAFLAFSLIFNMLVLIGKMGPSCRSKKCVVDDRRRNIVNCNGSHPFFGTNAPDALEGTHGQKGHRVPFEASDRVLVTGAAGFIGMHTCLRLVRPRRVGGMGLDPKSVVGIDHFDEYYSIELKLARQEELHRAGVEIFNASVCDARFLKHLFDKHDFTHVIHLAAQPGVRYGRQRPDKYLSSNIECFDILIESIIHHLPHTYLVYASSSSVYGANTKMPFSETDRVDLPVSLYGVTKRTNELLAAAYYMNSGLHSAGLRFFTVYGEWGRPDMVFFKFSYAIDNGLPITLFERGTLRRDFTYIDDIVDGVLRVCEYRAPADGRPGLPSSGRPAPEVFNLGNSRPVVVGRLIRLLEREMNRTAAVVDGGASADEVAATHANTSKAYWLLGWEPYTSIEEGVRRFAVWYRARARPEYYTVGAFHGEGGGGGGGAAGAKGKNLRLIELPRLEEFAGSDSDGGGSSSGSNATAPQGDPHGTTSPPPDAAAIRAAAARRPPHERLARISPGREPVVAVVTGSTSRGLTDVTTLVNHPLWTEMLTSALATAGGGGYECWFYIGYDAGDPLFENSDYRAALHTAFAQRRDGLAAAVSAQLALVRVDNPWHKPGPVFNLVSAAAHADGADYIYRVNDDVIFETPWAGPLAAALAAMSPANMGVIGPTCRQGNIVVLVCDFTHRTHLEIFGGLHYPSELTDWWLDDWITAVYPRPNTVRHPDVILRHRFMSHGRNASRYYVDRTRKEFLAPAVRRGRAAVDAHLRRRVGHQCAAMGYGAHNFSAVREAADAALTLAAEGDFPAPPKLSLSPRAARQRYVISPMAHAGKSVDAKTPLEIQAAQPPTAPPPPPPPPPAPPPPPRTRSAAAQLALDAIAAELDSREVVALAAAAAAESPYAPPRAIIMVVNEGISNLTLNWICALRARGLDAALRATVFVCLDPAVRALLSARGHRTAAWDVPGGRWHRSQEYGSEDYFALIHSRQKLILDLLLHNVSILVAEPDAAWYGDLVQFVDGHPAYRAADAVAYNDSEAVGHTAPCGGLLFLRAGPGAVDLVRALLEGHREALVKADAVASEQGVLRRVWTTAKGVYAILPPERFFSGLWYSPLGRQINAAGNASAAAAAAGDDPAALGTLFVHTNFMKGTARKQAHMRERGQWYLQQDLRCSDTPLRGAG